MSWDGTVYMARTFVYVLTGQSATDSPVMWFAIVVWLFGLYLQRFDPKENKDGDI